MNRIQKELTKHGATTEQVRYYIRRIRECEKLSKGRGHKHHILPVNCGWWKKYDKAPWNLVRVTLELHISLHADLCQIFSDNQSLKRALKITVSLLRPSDLADMKRDKKELIIKWYSKGISAKEIGRRRLKIDDSTVSRWLKEWGIVLRSYGDASVVHTWRARQRKEEIISWYQKGRSSFWIAKRVGVSWSTVINWLKYWEVEIRKPGWRGNGWITRNRRSASKKPV